MSQTKDWLPTRRTEQLAMAKNWHTVINKNRVKWSIPSAVQDDFEVMIETAQDCLADAQSSARTAVITAICKEAFDILVGKMRDIKKRYFLTPPLLDSDYIALGFNTPDTIPTPILPPTSQVQADLTFPGIHLVELQKIRPVSGSAPDSRSDYGVRVFWGLTGEPTETDKFRVTGIPKTGNDLPKSKFTRRHKEFFDFDGESGNTVYFCLRYESPTGGEGPFGPMLKAVVP
jgi:hypothetical protein